MASITLVAQYVPNGKFSWPPYVIANPTPYVLAQTDRLFDLLDLTLSQYMQHVAKAMGQINWGRLGWHLVSGPKTPRPAMHD